MRARSRLPSPRLQALFDPSVEIADWSDFAQLNWLFRLHQSGIMIGSIPMGAIPGRADLVEVVGCDNFVRLAHDEPHTAIAMLCRNPSLGTVRASWGETALEAASHMGHRPLVAALVDNGAELDLFAACVLGLKPAVAELLSGASAHGFGVHRLPILHFGVVGGDLGMVRLLLAAGVSVNPRGVSLPPLHSAVAAGSAQMVDLLLRAGADVAATDAFGSTAFDWATKLDGAGSVLVALLGTSRRAA